MTERDMLAELGAHLWRSAWRMCLGATAISVLSALLFLAATGVLAAFDLIHRGSNFAWLGLSCSGIALAVVIVLDRRYGWLP